MEHIHERIDKEVEIFKGPQQSKVKDHTDPKPIFGLFVVIPVIINFLAYKIIHKGTQENKKKKPPVPPTIKNIAGNYYQEVLIF